MGRIILAFQWKNPNSQMIATANRCEGVYNRAGYWVPAKSLPLCGVRRNNGRLIFIKKNRRKRSLFRRSVTFCEKGATPASAAGGGYRERGAAQLSASGKAALSAADGAGHRKRAGSGVSEL